MPRRNTPHTISLALLLLTTATTAATTAAAAEAPRPRQIGSRTQLLLDERVVATSHNVRMTMHSPRRDGRVLLTNDQPWESDPDQMVAVYCSLLYERGKFRLWYDLGHRSDRTRRVVAYAESSDGIHFVKPRLGLVEFGGSKENNVVMPGEIGGCCVWIDPGAPPEHRYKSQQKVYPSSQFHMYSSPDGIHWKMFRRITIGAGGWDTQSIIYHDSASRKYLMFTRFWHSHRHGTGVAPDNYRCVRRLESSDLVRWTNQSIVMAPNAADKALYTTPAGNPAVDYYGAAVFPYRDLTIMLTQAFWHWKPRPSGQKGLAPASFDVRLAVSTDSKTFRRVGNWRPFMAQGADGRFDSRYVWALPNPVVVGDEIWIYYAGSNRDHDDQLDPAAGGRIRTGIGRAVLRRDGWVSADADLAGGQLTTSPLKFKGTRLELNAATGGGGSIRVELLDENSRPLPGFSKELALPATGNSLRMPVTWKSGNDLARLAGKTIRLRFHLKDCRLYAFRFRDPAPPKRQ